MYSVVKVIHLNTVLPKPCPNKVVFFIFPWIWILKDIAVSAIKLWLFRSWKKGLLLAIYMPNLWKQNQMSSMMLLFKGHLDVDTGSLSISQ